MTASPLARAPTPPACRPTSTSTQYTSLVALMEESFQKYADRAGLQLHGQGRQLSRRPTACRRAFAAYLQGLGLQQGRPRRHHDAQRAAVPGGRGGHPARRLCGGQRQSAVHAARARAPAEGLAAPRPSSSSRTSPPRCSSAWRNTPVKHIVLCAMGDLLGLLKGALVNYVVRNVKKMVPAFNLPGAVRFNDAIAQGTRGTLKKPSIKAGRRGGAAVHRRHHRRVARARCCCTATGRQRAAVRGLEPARPCKKMPAGEQIVSVCALPLYHIFGFNDRT